MELKESKKIRVVGDVSKYRNAVLGLPVKDFRALKQGKEALIPMEIFKKFKIFTEVKDGD